MKVVYPALIIFILTLSPCSPGGEPTATPAPTTPIVVESPVAPTVEPTVAPTATPTPPEPPSAGPCQNPYYPVVASASWQYQLSGTSSDTFVRSITAVREDGFDEQDVFSVGTIRKSSWACREGNLINLTPGSSGVVVAADIQTNFTVESNMGITLPADSRPGTEWTQTIVYLGQQRIGDLDVESRNVMNLSCKAIGMERVSVPAGDLEALRVDCTTRLDISISSAPAVNITSVNSA